MFAFFFILFVAVSIPGGMRTPLSFSASDPQCRTLRFANYWLDCRSPQPARADSTLDDIIRIFGESDDAAYALGAKGLVEGNANWAMMTSIYPPGMMVLEALPYWFSRNAPIGLVLIITTSSMWATAFTLLAVRPLRSSRLGLLAITVPSLMILLPDTLPMTKFLFLTEPISIASLLCASGFLASTAERRGLSMIGPAALAGVFFAVSMYFRTAVEFTMVVLAGLALVLGVFFALKALVRRYRSAGRDNGIRALSRRRSLLSLATALTFFVLTTGPYWLANHGRWVDTTTGWIWDLVWKTPAEIRPELQFFVQYGGAAGCSVDRRTCDDVHSQLRKNAAAFTHKDFFNLTVRAALHHPIAWLRFKLGFIARGWFDGTPSSIVASILMLPLAFVGVFSGSQPAFILTLILMALIAGTFGPLLLIQVEPRYLLPLRMFVLYSAALTAGFLQESRKARGSWLNSGRADRTA
jgi:hypothetical protein